MQLIEFDFEDGVSGCVPASDFDQMLNQAGMLRFVDGTLRDADEVDLVVGKWKLSENLTR